MDSWNLTSNSLTEFLQLNAGIDQPYVPTVIGPDGQVYTLNGGTRSAMGSINGVGIALTSSTPHVRSLVGKWLTFTVAVTHTGTSGISPTGTVTLQDTTYYVPSPNVLNSNTTTLVSNLPLDGTGHASYTTSALAADTHFITVSYSAEGNFSSGSSSLIQVVHASESATTLTSSPNSSNAGQSVTFTATMAASPPGSGTPTGQVTFRDGSHVLWQAPVDGSSVVSFKAQQIWHWAIIRWQRSMRPTLFCSQQWKYRAVGSSRHHRDGKFVRQPMGVQATPQVYGDGYSRASGERRAYGHGHFPERQHAAGNWHIERKRVRQRLGSYSITAVYGGSPIFRGTTSSTLTQTVNKDSTSTTVTSSLDPSMHAQSATFTATVAASALGTGIPTGMVIFTDGARNLHNVSLSRGQASYTTDSLLWGTQRITAVYQGNSNFQASALPSSSRP